MNTLKTIKITDGDLKNSDYNYQEKLTGKLDIIDSDFNQEIINEIVLWKVNRFASISEKTLQEINKIQKTDINLDIELTAEILKGLLGSFGIRLAMASTILRFKNPKIYQIIDQRVYRFLKGEELKYSVTNIEKQIELYLDYLKELKRECEKYNIDFEKSDRIIYEMDKKYNKGLKIKY